MEGGGGGERGEHGLINYIDTKEIVVISKNWPVKGLCGSAYLSEAPSSPMTPYPPPPPVHTVYVFTEHLFTQRSGGRGDEPELR